MNNEQPKMLKATGKQLMELIVFFIGQHNELIDILYKHSEDLSINELEKIIDLLKSAKKKLKTLETDDPIPEGVVPETLNINLTRED